MATEPERRIEKLLRAYAKKHRRDAEPPLEISPAARRRLQGEVARRATANQPAATPVGWLAALRTHWLFASIGAAAVVLIAVGITLSPNREEVREFAATAKKAAPPPPISAPAAGTQAEPPVRMLLADNAPGAQEKAQATRTDSLQQTLRKDAAATRETLNTPTVAATPPANRRAPAEQSAASRPMVTTVTDAETQPVLNRDKDKTTTLGTESLAYQQTQLSDAPVMAAGTASAGGAAVPGGVAAESLAVPPSPPEIRQRFYRTASGARLADSRNRADGIGGGGGGFGGGGSAAGGSNGALHLPDPSVLAVFEAVRTNDILKIMDGDGSVYQGYIQAPTASGTIAASREEKSEAPTLARAATPRTAAQFATPPAASLNAGLTFVVSGTNHTLNQLVIFKGSFSPSAAPGDFSNAFYRGNAVGETPAGATGAPFPYSRVSGTAVIGGRTEIPIEAAPAPQR
jgi:uncharacterized membrane protein YgcG